MRNSIKMAAGSHFVARNAIEIHFRSSKIGWGGGASQWSACKPFGDIHSIWPWADTPILVLYGNIIICVSSGGTGNKTILFEGLEVIRPMSTYKTASIINHCKYHYLMPHFLHLYHRRNLFFTFYYMYIQCLNT